MPMTGFGDFAEQIRQMLQLGGAAPGVQPATLYNFSNPPPANGPGPGNVGPVPLSSAAEPGNPYAAAASVTGPAPAPSPAPPVAAQTAPPAPVAAPPAPPQQGPYGAAGYDMPPWSPPLPPVRPSKGPYAPAAASTAAAPVVASTPAAASTAAPIPPQRSQAPNLGYYPPNPRFGTMQSQVGGGRGALSNNPIYTTMNLFGGGADKSAANAAAAAPATAAKGHALPPGDNWDVDNQGNIIPNYGDQLPSDPTQMNPTALASAVSKPNWWQQFGRQEMNPDQLARAVKKPNWWQNV